MCVWPKYLDIYLAQMTDSHDVTSPLFKLALLVTVDVFRHIVVFVQISSDPVNLFIVTELS